MTREDLKGLLDEGNIHFVNIEEVRGHLGTKSFVVRLRSMIMAQRLVDEWGNRIVDGNRLQMTILDESFGDEAGDSSSSYQPMYSSNSNNNHSSSFSESEMVDVRSMDIPLRILVPNDFIGAIIGRGGTTIRSISKGTGARLDIFRHVNRNYDMPEKPISISGSKEKTSAACRRVLEIMVQECDHVTKERLGDITLKIFVPNAVVGRIIGKSGAVVKSMMEDTQTKIHISNQPDFMEDHRNNNSFNSNHSMNRRNVNNNNNNQRVITIRGSIDGMSKAEKIISEKVREAVAEGKVRERDLEFGSNLGNRIGNSWNNNNGGMGPPNSPFMASMSPSNKYFNQYDRRYDFGMRSYNNNGNNSNNISPGRGNFGMDPNNEGVVLSRPETGYMYVPDEIVGALIGRKGESIREIIHASGASIKIMEGIIYVSSYPTRRVVIHGGEFIWLVKIYI